MVLKGGYIEFRDMMRLTGPAKLATLCKDFKLPPMFSKSEFPQKVASREHLNDVGEVPADEYWPSGVSPEEHIGKLFDFKEVNTKYQKLDCVSACIIRHKLSKNIYDMTKLRTSDFVTGPYRFLLESVPKGLIKICSDRSVDAWIRSAIQGGRCFPQKAFFKSRFADAKTEAWKNKDHWTRLLECS